jgi:hypothetical protein
LPQLVEDRHEARTRTPPRVILRSLGAVEAAIALRNKFLFVKGEYFLDTRQGVPYFQYVFVKNPDLLIVKDLFTQVIKSVPGVASIDRLDVSFDRATRKGAFSFRAIAANGKVITGGSGQPFIVEPQ